MAPVWTAQMILNYKYLLNSCLLFFLVGPVSGREGEAVRELLILTLKRLKRSGHGNETAIATVIVIVTVRGAIVTEREDEAGPKTETVKETVVTGTVTGKVLIISLEISTVGS